MPILSVGLHVGRINLPRLASLAHAGQGSLLTKHGKPYAAIVAPEVLLKGRRKSGFLNLRGSGVGLWGASPAQHVDALRSEWG